ncbi:Type-2 restriction enzyme NgoMIV [Gossypium australe]|uniref:Type-2 restriction enzyme NgoMIV n=1 Tax=Gossypium australe TaxID=47621 RepID=A0A5B6VNC1_9ROSI|nr:Type-2 restriction enzyme NgoMIV [Gossypium australe]
MSTRPREESKGEVESSASSLDRERNQRRAQARSESINLGDDREPKLEERVQPKTELVPPEEEILVTTALLQTMNQLLQQLVRTTNVPPVSPPPPFAPKSQLYATSHRNPLEKIRKYGAEEIKGKEEDDLVETKEWLENNQQTFEEL